MAIAFPDIDPVAVSFGPFAVRWYALAYLAGFLIGWRYALYLAGRVRDCRPNAEDIDNFLPLAVAGVILGGRLGYVLFYQPGYYLEYPLDALKIWQGGMSFHGGLAGVVLVTLLFCRFQKIPLLRLSDILACAVPPGLFFGRIANFVNGELFGRPAPDLPWAVAFPRGGDIPRHPSQLYEAVLEGLVIFAVLFVMSRRRVIRERPGILAATFIFLYGSFRFLVEYFRAPDPQLGLLFGGLTMGQYLSLPLVIFGLALAGVVWRRGP